MSEERLFKTYERELKEFEDWISQNPRLPKNISKIIDFNFIRGDNNMMGKCFNWKISKKF